MILLSFNYCHTILRLFGLSMIDVMIVKMMLPRNKGFGFGVYTSKSDILAG